MGALLVMSESEPYSFDVSPAGKLVFQRVTDEVKSLRNSLERFEGKLTMVAEALIRIETQNVAATVAEMKKDEINPLKDRVKKIEDGQLRLAIVVAIVGTIWGGLVTAIMLWLAYKQTR